MSKFEAPLVEIILEEHPNADSLSIVKIGGYQCVVKTEEFKNEKLAVYVPIDTVAPVDHPLLGFLNGKKVSVCKLRGVYSEGILLPFSIVIDCLKTAYGVSETSIQKISVIGKDFGPILRLKKYYEQRIGGNGMCEKENEDFLKYTDIEPYKKYLNVLSEGELVQVTEKLHGSNFRAGILDGKFCLGSRKRQLSIDIENHKQSIWNYVYKEQGIEDKIVQIVKILNSKNVTGDIKSVTIYGEVIGPGVQILQYGLKVPTLYVFDIAVNGKYLPPTDTFNICSDIELLHVPSLYVGPCSQSVMDYVDGQTTLCADHVREGVVVKPIIPRFDLNLGRVILKIVSNYYRGIPYNTDIDDE